MLFLISSLALIPAIYSTNPSIQVTTSRGPIIGYHFDQGRNASALYYGQADVFLGVPYVQPPTGSLRYKVKS